MNPTKRRHGTLTAPRRRGLRFTLTLGLGALTLLPAATIQAQAKATAPSAASPDKQAADALSPPRLVTFVEAVYPAAAKAAGQSAAVELELDLDAEGKVTAARVATPSADADGFEAAAVEAARRFLFEPARRGEQAIPARIRYRYVFELAPAPAPAATTGKLGGRVLMKGSKGANDVVLCAAVTLTSEDGAISRSAATRGDGGFEFGELPPGRYRLQVAGREVRSL